MIEKSYIVGPNYTDTHSSHQQQNYGTISRKTFKPQDHLANLKDTLEKMIQHPLHIFISDKEKNKSHTADYA